MSGSLTDPDGPLKATFSEWKPIFEKEGFVVSGAVDFDLARPLYETHVDRYRNWVKEGKHGEMQYLLRGLERRENPKLVFPELQSVIAVAKPYSPHPVGSDQFRYARYLNGPDYHEEMKAGLQRAFDSLASSKALPENFQYKICVDTSSVLERSWAAICGLGWIGKNTLLIHPQHGSYLFLGVIFTNAIFDQGPDLLKDYCGHCTRCISACPTSALKSHDLDSKACISYLTLEKRGPYQTEVNTAGFLAGCDLCQEVCPYNTKATRSVPIPPVSRHLVMDHEVLHSETEVEYKERVKGTSLSRVKYPDFRRNFESVVSSKKK